MTFIDPYTHTASIAVDVDAETALAFMADAMEQTHWALGSVRRRPVEGHDNLFLGNSSFTGEELYVRQVPHHEHLTIDSYIGPSPDDLTPLVHTRIQPGENVGLRPDQCVITLTTWRAGEPEDDWHREYWVWRTEVHLIKGRIDEIQRQKAEPGGS